MKLIALERRGSGVRNDQTAPHLQAEARRVWELTQTGAIREIYFRQDRSEAVIVLECDSPGEAEKIIASLPLVQLGLIRFEIIPLVPYPGFARLFK